MQTRLAIHCIVLITFLVLYHARGENVQVQQNGYSGLDDALQFLTEYGTESAAMCFRVSNAQWIYSTNMTDYNKRRMIDEQTLRAKFEKISWRRASRFNLKHLPDAHVRRQIRFVLNQGNRGALSDEKYNEIYHLTAEMKDIYSHVRVCPFIKEPDNNTVVHGDGEKVQTNFCDLQLEPDVVGIMAKSRNAHQLAYTWNEWHTKAGVPLKLKFMRYVQIANQAARLNGYRDSAEQMLAEYEVLDDGFETELADTWRLVRPLYVQLFTYVRHQLWRYYSDGVVRKDGPIPAHLLGNIWAQDWGNLYDLVVPFPRNQHVLRDTVTGEMLRQGFNPTRMFRMAQDFFVSLGMKSMPPEFWRHSMLERPKDRNVQCTPSAWNFCNAHDYRIKMCTEVSAVDLVRIHHEMAHIQYYMYYGENVAPIYRDGANPAFHEGVASAISLAVYNPAHLHHIGLLDGNSVQSYGTNVNFLMELALSKVAFLPFAYLVDLWRFKLFRTGDVQSMNRYWWEMRLRYQGVVPTVPRTEYNFDAGAKRHIPAGVPYMRYYVALLLEFQIFAEMCAQTKQTTATSDLHNCDVYRSQDAGKILTDVMKLGKSRHWREVLKVLTQGRTDKLNAKPMLDYFEPLHSWLREQNKNASLVGWSVNWEEEALFQPFISSKSHSAVLVPNCIIINIILFVNFYTKFYQ